MSFNYSAPDSKEEALEMLAIQGKNAAILAGGTDLLIAVKEKSVKVSHIVDFKSLEILNEITIDSSGNINIGAFTTVRTIEKSQDIASKYPFLANAGAMLGSLQIRNRATVGGNLCNASPCANLALPLLALDAELLLEKKGSSRKVAIGEFFISNGVTCKSDDEMLTEIDIKNNKGKGIFIIHSKRRAMDIPSVGICINLDLGKNKKIEEARIAMGSVAPVPIRAMKTEKMLKGNPLNDNIIIEAADMAAGEASPISDGRASAWYREQIVKALILRGLSSLK